MIILGWNRDFGEVSWPDYDEYYDEFQKYRILLDLTWSVGRHKNIPADSFCALIVQGEKHPRGMVAFGMTSGEPWPGPHWDPAHGGQTMYINWDVLGMLPADDPIPISVLAERVPGPPWLTGIQGSGYTVPEESELALIDLWAEYAGDFTKPPKEQKKAFREGARVSGVYNRYERNPMARKACLDHYGYVCAVCGLDPIQMYGDKIGPRAIEVHHIKPISTRGGVEHSVDHIKDLRPLCPSCHAAIHAADPLPTPAQFKSRLEKRWAKQ